MPIIHVAVPEDAVLPADFVMGTEATAGIRIVQTPVSQKSIDELLSESAGSKGDSDLSEQLGAVIGVDSESAATLPEGAVRYGEDNLCSLLDLAWYSANKLDPPESLVEGSSGIQQGSVFLTVRSEGLAGADSRWKLLEGTCVPVGVYLVPLETQRTDARLQQRVAQFSEYLLSPQGQEAVGTYGLAFPLGTKAGQTIEVVSTGNREINLERPAN